jgi:hypothetical protein
MPPIVAETRNADVGYLRGAVGLAYGRYVGLDCAQCWQRIKTLAGERFKHSLWIAFAGCADYLSQSSGISLTPRVARAQRRVGGDLRFLQRFYPALELREFRLEFRQGQPVCNTQSDTHSKCSLIRRHLPNLAVTKDTIPKRSGHGVWPHGSRQSGRPKTRGPLPTLRRTALKTTIKDLPRNEEMDSSKMATVEGGGGGFYLDGLEGSGDHRPD